MADTDEKTATLVKDPPKPIDQLPQKHLWKTFLNMADTEEKMATLLVKDSLKPIDQLVISFTKKTCVEIII